MSFLMLDSPNPFTAQGTFPRRGVRGKLTGTAILHTSEGNWQAGVDSLTRLVRTRSDYGCYHVAVDWVDTAWYYPWEWETWQDSETNNWAVGIAAACRTADWHVMPAEIREGYIRNMAAAAADFVKYMKAQYGVTVPLVRISGAQARAGVPGFCAHGDSGIARSDPGANFPWGTFFEYTKQALSGVKPAGTTKKELFTVDQFDQIMNKLTAIGKDARNTWSGTWAGGKYGSQEFKYGALPIVAHNQVLMAQYHAQQMALLKEIASLVGGADFDEEALLERVRVASAEGVAQVIGDQKFALQPVVEEVDTTKEGH